LATAAYVCVFGITFIFSLFAITYTSQADNLVSSRSASLQSVNDIARQVDNSIYDQYTSYVDGLDTNARRACRGLDESGIAKCGAIANGFSQKSNSFREQFGPQLASRSTFSPTKHNNFAEDVVLTDENLKSVTGKMAAYVQFGSASHISTKSASDKISSAFVQLRAAQDEATSSSADKKGLVIHKVFADILSALHRKADALSYFAMMIAALPVLISVLCTMLLRVVESANDRALRIKRATAHLKEEAEETQRYAGVVGLCERSCGAARRDGEDDDSSPYGISSKNS
jgi:hypothetical protein